MADNQFEITPGGHAGDECRKTTKTSTEYRKTESESHELERGGDYEKRAVTSETHEKSVTRSETVEIRRGVGQAFQPDRLPADWHQRMPELVRLSLAGVRPDTCADASLFDGDYILNLVDRHADGCRWEVAFDPHCRLYRAALTAGPSFGQLVTRAELQGGVAGPRWSASGLASFDQPIILRQESADTGAISGCLWPETVTIAPIRAVAPTQGRFDISPEPTAAERAAMAALATSSSSSGCGPIDCTTDCHCVCPCPCCEGGTMSPTPSPLTSVPNSPMHISRDSDRPVRYGNGEVTLAVTDLAAGGFGQEFGHTRIFSNRLDDWDYGNGFNWLVRDLPKLVQLGIDAPGYTQSESVQQGANGTPISLKQYQYTQVSAGGVTIYPTIAATVFRDDAGAQPITTNFAYAFFSGTTAVQQRTTIWPVVPASQNGSGVAESRVDQFDAWGNPASSTNERGVATQFVTDIVTGGLLQRVDDATGMALVSDFQVDNLGRTVQSLGPAHTIDLGGVATVVRTASWTVFDDVNMQVRTARGYATVAAALRDGVGRLPSATASPPRSVGATESGYTYTLVNPVAITIMDGDGNVTDQVSATRASTAGPLLPGDTFAQSSYVRWTHNVFNDNDQQTASRVYFAIPASGDGTKGVSYNESLTGYDSIGRENRQVNGGGTITRTVRDARDLPLSIWIGTNDTGATDTDPTGGGAPGNNMAAVQSNVYDGGTGGGDGNQTLQIMPVDGNAANNRVTGMEYDWRNRQARINLAQDSYQLNTFDTMDHIVQVDRHSQATGNLIGRSATNYDNRGRAYQSLRYAVDPTTGAVGNALTDNTWYDPAGNLMMQLPAGSSAFTKPVYDALNRQTAQYVGFYPPGSRITYAQAADISGATIVEQSETAWDEASNGVQNTTRKRFHNATGLGPLTQPGGAQPQARVAYAAMYPDGVGRQQAAANYGTNGDTPLTRPATIPARSDTVLVNSTAYNDRGEPYQSIDAAATVTQTTLDDAGRRTELVRNFQSGQPSTGDVNVTVNWTFTADDQTATMTAVNTATGDQTTAWNHGVTMPGSDVARNDVVSGMIYPDGGQVQYLVNRQSERKQFTDQNGTVHAYDRDLLGREISDRVVTLGTGIDGTVQRISRTFEVRGLLQNVTSYASPVVGQGVVVNDVQRVYNSFEQCVTEYQEHNGAVDPATSVKVGYLYADGSANTTRQTGLLYPNGRLITMGYGTAGGIDDALSRVANLIDADGTHLVDYLRIGVSTFVQSNSPQPQIAWSLINGTGIDPYTGLDQFNRVVDNRWYNTATSADLDRIQHGYDRASNRRWRKNTVADAAGVFLDELYAYDGLYRLARLARGQLNSTNNGIVAGTEDFTQAWGLDATGNWSTFNQADTGGAWTLQQNRTANAVNEITGIAGGGWVVPAFDSAGNMVVMPQPAQPTSGYSAIYDGWNREVSRVLRQLAGKDSACPRRRPAPARLVGRFA